MQRPWGPTVSEVATTSLVAPDNPLRRCPETLVAHSAGFAAVPALAAGHTQCWGPFCCGDTDRTMLRESAEAPTLSKNPLLCQERHYAHDKDHQADADLDIALLDRDALCLRARFRPTCVVHACALASNHTS